MTGFRPFLAKEAKEIVHTWRIWVLPLILLALAVMSAVTAYLLPALLGGMDLGGGLVIEVPDPTWVDSYAQWAKNLAQIATIALVISLGGAVNGEVRNGTAVMMLARPVSRPAFVLAKVVASLVLVLGATVLGAVVTFGLTAALFPGAPLEPLAAGTAVWLVLALLLLAVTFLGSAWFTSALGAAGLGLGVYMVISIAAIWQPAERWSPAGLTTAPAHLATGGSADWIWPVVTGILLAVLVLAGAVAVFRRRELAA
ncbi:MAG TPA: ABC transporter permease subunit [Actinomycetaceae bacterium]|nr:ABC transporter permease subunit [Actinomycetaceae bacterium]